MKFVPGQRVFHKSLRLYGVLVGHIATSRTPAWYVNREGATSDPKGYTNQWAELYLEAAPEVKANPTALDTQIGGGHYKTVKIQPVEYAHANDFDFFQGSVLKYITRHKDKNKKQDLEKAIHFLQLYIALEYPDVAPAHKVVNIVRGNLAADIAAARS